MDRRSLLRTGLTATAAVATASVARAPSAFGAVNAKAIIASTSKCLTVSLQCLAHCDEMLATGDKSMAECQSAVTDTIATCESLLRLAARNSKHLPAFAALCAQVCADCAAACEKHADKMAICKECMDACKECEKACKAA